MAQPVSRDAGGGDGALLLSLAAIVVGLGAGGWYLWQEQHAGISVIVMQILHGQMRVIHLFTNRYELADTQVLAANPAKVTAVQLLQLAREVGRFFLVPAIALVLGLAVICFRRATPMRFSRRLDLDGLLREQARAFRSPAAAMRKLSSGRIIHMSAMPRRLPWVGKASSTSGSRAARPSAIQQCWSALAPIAGGSLPRAIGMGPWK